MAKKYYLINQEVYPVNTAEAGIRIFMDDPFTSGMSIDEYKKHFKKQQAKIGIKTPDSALKNNETFWAYLNKIKAVKLATPSEKKLLNNEMKPQNKMNKSINGVTKKSDYRVYHRAYSSAISEALDYAKKKGYEYNEDDVWNRISMGKKKPSEGKTNRATITLFKNGKEQKKALHIQVYGMKNQYELNTYIN